jgi:EAL domain-containing protein (putative c-di-GMP-specific phosphodiesterase class I)
MQYNVGIVQAPLTGEIPALELIQQVEIAQAEADESGALYCIYDENLMAKRARHQQIESMFRKSLEAGEFEVWYQPKYDLYTNEAAGAEALVRWNSSAMGEVQPAGFVPVLERTSLILELDYYVLEKTMRYLKGRIDAGLPVVPVSVNQSGKHVAETGYLDRMRQLAEKIPLPKGLIELEITETAFVDYETQAAREDAVHIARELRSMGYRLAMDDFCTGYSSIAMLQTLPMDTIKIDRAVLLAAEKDSKGLTILRGVIDFGRRLGMTVLCEGIETREQEQMLRENGCMLGQGFLYAEPMDEEQFSEFLGRKAVN